MSPPTDFKITSEMLWRGTLILALMDVGFVALLAWRVRRSALRRIKWTLVGTTGLFFCGLWVWALENYWDTVYSHLFPLWARGLIPLAYGLLFAAVALLFWWLALCSPSNPAASFCLLGGLWGIISHLWAVQRGIVSKPPLLQGVAPAAAVVLAAFEFIFYWCVTLSVAYVLRRGWEWRGQRR